MTDLRAGGITRLTVAGYKSIAREQSIEIRPLTILAGANSSGKSSMLQPLLLLKQTLEATYDPGVLLLNGPNVTFSSARQMLSHKNKAVSRAELRIGMGFTADADLTLDFEWQSGQKLAIQQMTVHSSQAYIKLHPSMSHATILDASSPQLRQELEQSLTTLGLMYQSTGLSIAGEPVLQVKQRRCFLDIVFVTQDNGSEQSLSVLPLSVLVEPAVRNIIHLPGLRGIPARAYPVTASGPQFPGPFQQYVASVIAQWQESGQQHLIEQLGEQLKALGLTRRVVAMVQNEAQIELLVDRFPIDHQGKTSDLVNIVDVGIGVSQTLPVLVALLVAVPDQLVYIEQPEIHLHPRAQVALAQMLVDGARRGVRVVVETHSSLLLLAIQALVAEGKLPPDLVKLHWFKRDKKDGMTNITSADLDETGAFGDWPEDFDAVELSAQSRYLDAAESHQLSR